MRPIIRLAVLTLAAIVLAGCAGRSERMRLAREGPRLTGSLADAGRRLQPEDLVALHIADPRRDAAQVRACVATALADRFPGGRPAPRSPDPQAVAALAALLEPFRSGPDVDATALALPADLPTHDIDWFIIVEDLTTVTTTPASVGDLAFRFGTSPSDLVTGESTYYTLRLRAEVFDLRSRRRLGALSVSFPAFGVSALVLGGGTIFPLIVLPVGTSGLTVCNAMGRALGDALRDAAPASRTGDAPGAT